jgi:2-oxoglutarate ferredoxin oxidoreductase subunit delta
MPLKGTIVVGEDLCKACELCIEACPQHVIAINEEVFTPRGYHPAHLVDEGCTGCGICAQVCPDIAITVYREKPSKN